MNSSDPVTEGHLDTKLAEFRDSVERRIDTKIGELGSSLEARFDTKSAELRASIETRLNDQTRWVIGWMTVLVLGATGLVISLG